MKRFYFIFFLLFGLSNFSLGKVKFQKAIGMFQGVPNCKYHIEPNDKVICNDKDGKFLKFPVKGVKDIRKSVVKRNLLGQSQPFVFEFKDGAYKLGYIWDTVNQESIVFDDIKNPHLDGLTMPLYMKAFLKNSYEVRYYWFKPNIPLEKLNSNFYITIDKGIKSFNFTSEHNVELFDTPNGKVISHVLGDKIKKYKIDFSHSKGKELGPHSTEEHMVMNALVLDSKYVKNELWYQVKIPLTETYDELDFIILKEHGKVPTPITFKQSIFNEEKVGWIKVFDEDGFFVFR